MITWKSTWGITLAGWPALRHCNWLISLTPLVDWRTTDWLKNGFGGWFMGVCCPDHLELRCMCFGSDALTRHLYLRHILHEYEPDVTALFPFLRGPGLLPLIQISSASVLVSESITLLPWFTIWKKELWGWGRGVLDRLVRYLPSPPTCFSYLRIFVNHLYHTSL